MSALHAIGSAVLLLAAALTGSCRESGAGETPSTARTESAESGAGPVTIRSGETASLAPGGETRVEGTGALARFVRVVEDSRCPRGVTCVWAGRAVVEVEVSREGSEAPSHLLELEVGEAPERSIQGHGVRWTAIALMPYPVAEQALADEDRRLRLRADVIPTQPR